MLHTGQIYCINDRSRQESALEIMLHNISINDNLSLEYMKRI